MSKRSTDHYSSSHCPRTTGQLNCVSLHLADRVAMVGHVGPVPGVNVRNSTYDSSYASSKLGQVLVDPDYRVSENLSSSNSRPRAWSVDLDFPAGPVMICFKDSGQVFFLQQQQ